MNKTEKIQRRALKRILNMLISTSHIGLIMESGTWPANQRIQYSVMMLYHNAMNSDHKSSKKNNSRTSKRQPQEHHDLKSKTNSTRNKTENKKCGEHEQQNPNGKSR